MQNDELIAALEAAHKALRWQWQATGSIEHRSNAALIRAHIDSLRAGGGRAISESPVIARAMGFLAGYVEGANTERAAIVAWLRDGATVFGRTLADAIAAGDHVSKTGD